MHKVNSMYYSVHVIHLWLEKCADKFRVLFRGKIHSRSSRTDGSSSLLNKQASYIKMFVGFNLLNNHWITSALGILRAVLVH